MAFRITNQCIVCGVCKDACPVKCIYLGDEHYMIDEEKCIDCGTCKAVCPVDVPYQVEE